MSGGAARLIDLDGEGFHNDEDAAAAAADDDAYAGGSAVATPGGSRVTFRDEGGGSGMCPMSIEPACTHQLKQTCNVFVVSPSSW